MAAYLDAWLEDAPEDAAGIARALGDIARAKGMTQVVSGRGLSRESLYKALGANGNPTFATVLKVAKALGVRFHAEVAQFAVELIAQVGRLRRRSSRALNRDAERFCASPFCLPPSWPDVALI